MIGNVGDLILATVGVLPEGHPKRVFYEWYVRCARDRTLEAAIIELGVELPAEGYNLVGRIEDAVTPVLMKRLEEGKVDDA